TSRADLSESVYLRCGRTLKSCKKGMRSKSNSTRSKDCNSSRGRRRIERQNFETGLAAHYRQVAQARRENRATIRGREGPGEVKEIGSGDRVGGFFLRGHLVPTPPSPRPVSTKSDREMSDNNREY